MYDTFYFCPILLKLVFFSTEFRKILQHQILWNSVQWEQSCPVRTDGQI
jgi:hypothetical protein